MLTRVYVQCVLFSDNSVVENLKALSPSKIDVEIRCLGPESGGSLELMEYFLQAMHEALKTNRNFELVHSYLALFLQVSLFLTKFPLKPEVHDLP